MEPHLTSSAAVKQESIPSTISWHGRPKKEEEDPQSIAFLPTDSDTDQHSPVKQEWGKKEEESTEASLMFSAFDSGISAMQEVEPDTMSIQENEERHDTTPGPPQNLDVGIATDSEQDVYGSATGSERPVKTFRDIRGAFSEVLEQEFTFDGSFLHSQQYMMTAPNPFLRVEGLGLIGLPLSDRDAQTLVGFCTPHPSGMGVIMPSQVSIENSEWDRWVHTTVMKDVLKALAVDSPDCRCEFEGILIQEAGST